MTKVVMFNSRNKDNREVNGFKERHMHFFADDPMESYEEKFTNFVQNGCKGEMCRMYVSVNARDMQKAKKALVCRMVMDDDFNLAKVQSEAVGFAMKHENAAEHQWLFDFDLDDSFKLLEFVEEVQEHSPCFYHKTPHGWAVVAEHGFDTRSLLEKWGEWVTLKRDDMLCYKWATK